MQQGDGMMIGHSILECRMESTARKPLRKKLFSSQKKNDIQVDPYPTGPSVI